MKSSASPRERRGPMAASLARAVMSEPENPGTFVGQLNRRRKKKKEIVIKLVR